MKVVINTCYGGFSLNDKAFERYLDLKGVDYYTGESLIFGGKSYYTVPVEEYEAINKECSEVCNYERANDLYLSQYDIQRDDPILVQVVEEMGKDSWGGFAELKIVEIPEGVEWTLEEYDGREWVAEVHRTWS